MFYQRFLVYVTKLKTGESAGEELQAFVILYNNLNSGERFMHSFSELYNYH